MIKSLLRAVAFLLIPCLLADAVSLQALAGRGCMASLNAKAYSMNEQALAAAPQLAFHRPTNVRASAWARRTTKLLYATTLVGMSWIPIRLWHAPFPRYLPFSVFFIGYISLCLGVSEMWVRLFPKSRKDYLPSGSIISLRLGIWTILSSAALVGAILIDPMFFTRNLSRFSMNQHQLWTMVLTILSVSLTMRTAYVLHQARFWREGDPLAYRRTHQLLFITGVFLVFVGIGAGIAVYKLQDTSFFNPFCFRRNLLIGVCSGAESLLLFLGWPRMKPWRLISKIKSFSRSA